MRSLEEGLERPLGRGDRLRHWHQWRFGESHRRPDLTLDRAGEQIDRFPRALGGIDVRVGVVGGDDVDPIDHRLPDIGVQIEGDGDRHIRSSEVAHAARDLGLGVRKTFGHHRPVQGEHDTVGRQRGGECWHSSPARVSNVWRSGTPVETPSAKNAGASSMPRSRQASMTPPSQWLRPAKASSSSPRATTLRLRASSVRRRRCGSRA